MEIAGRGASFDIQGIQSTALSWSPSISNGRSEASAYRLTIGIGTAVTGITFQLYQVQYPDGELVSDFHLGVRHAEQRTG